MSGESTVMPPRKLHDADVVYLYDGSFEGFLCCVFESFAQHEIPFAVWTPQRETATLYPRPGHRDGLCQSAAGLFGPWPETGPGDGISRQPGFPLRAGR